MRNNLLITILFLSVSGSTFCQYNYDATQFKNESIEFVKQPLNWDENDWLKLGATGASVFLVIQADQTVREMFQRNAGYKKSIPMELGRMYGELYSPVLIAGAFGLHNLITQDLYTRKIAFEILQTTLYAGAITTALKFAFGRIRPTDENESKSFGHWTIYDDSFHSFPSGHTTVAFSISTVLSKNAKSDFLKVVAYLPAVLTAVSRVYQDNHWTSDVLLGGLIGYALGDWVTSNHKTKISFQAFSPRQLSLLVPLD
jgi:hypothetical protein